jgi:AcrR family transcriptional regulator
MPKPTFFNLPDEKRQPLIDIAIDEFAEHDYKNVSISRFVRRAGIAKGSFYQYFEDKKDLYLHLISMTMQEKTRFFEQNPPPDPAAGIFDFLRWTYENGTRFEFSNPKLAKIGYRAIYGDAPLPTETLAAARDGSITFFRHQVEQAIQRGDLADGTDPEAAAFLFNSVYMNLGDYLIRKTGINPEILIEDRSPLDTPEARDFFNNILALLENGMASPG